ncbi:MAG: DUF3096 domain-containing protein [Dehalococcoidia bacterium]|jgi:uncharacterized membrane protein HdeD (DUF308 family)
MSLGVSKWVLGVIAIVAGLLCLFWFSALQWIVGIFLIVWGIITLLEKK